jgi:hypothetical protein
VALAFAQPRYFLPPAASRANDNRHALSFLLGWLPVAGTIRRLEDHD